MTDYTIDHYPVEKGMLVWDYDLRPAIVGDPVPNGHPAEPVWYSMTDLDGRRSSTMDAKRMWVRHPSTGRRVTPPADVVIG